MINRQSISNANIEYSNVYSLALSNKIAPARLVGKTIFIGSLIDSGDFLFRENLFDIYSGRTLFGRSFFIFVSF